MTILIGQRHDGGEGNENLQREDLSFISLSGLMSVEPIFDHYFKAHLL